MSNRENLRRIAALSLVIAFGMSGAAGLAEAADVIPAEGQEEPVKKENPIKLTCDTIAIQQIIANSHRNGTSLHSPAE